MVVHRERCAREQAEVRHATSDCYCCAIRSAHLAAIHHQ